MTPLPHSSDRSSRFIGALRARLGVSAVDQSAGTLARLSSNVGAFERMIAGVLYPTDREGVATLVRLAAEHGVHLYPVSSGRNWGLGSALPVSSHNFVVDLSRLNRIRKIDLEFGWAEVEAGVTQGQLADRLAESKAPFFLDVTGSARQTSIVGNTLERGVAYNSQRTDTLRSLEVVLATGQILRTGFGDGSRLTGLYRHGIGPALDGLFCQSNLGIVTAATVALLPQPECHETFLVSLPGDGGLGALCEALRRLYDQGVARSVVHIANRRRGQTSMAPLVYEAMLRQGRKPNREEVMRLLGGIMRGAWSAVGCLMGAAGLVRESRNELTRRLRPLGTVRILNDSRLRWMTRVCSFMGLKNQLAFLEATSALMGVNRGMPTDEALRSLYWPHQVERAGFTDVDAGEGGIRYSLPLIPMEASAVAEAQRILAEVEQRWQAPIAVTLNTLHGRCLEAVISVDFARSDRSAFERARAAIDHLNAEFRQRGFELYRVDIDTMRSLTREPTPHWDAVQNLKHCLDPHHIIAPGRYCPYPEESECPNTTTLP